MSLFIHTCMHSFPPDEKFKAQSSEGAFLNSQGINAIAMLGEYQLTGQFSIMASHNLTAAKTLRII